MKRTILFAIVFAFTFAGLVDAHEFRRGKTMFDVWCASCRVSVSGARGSGIFCGVYNNLAIVLTNYHVVEEQANATLQFRNTGEPRDVRGRIVARFYNANLPADFAFVGVEVDEMAAIDPPFIPLAGADAEPTVNSFILSSGAPKGRFVQAWKGKILSYYNGATALFEPGPVPGQSGSAIVSEIDGELWVTGILTWLIGREGADDARGGAIPISKLYEAARGQKTSEKFLSPIPPNAKECADRDELEPIESAVKSTVPFVLEFTRNDCQPCERAKADVKKIRDANVPVYVLNVSETDDARERADNLRVVGFPTFIVFSASGKEQDRFVGAGYADNIVESANACRQPEPTEPTEPTTTDADALELQLIPTIPSTNAEPEDFRDRPPVHQISDASFLDDSDARWRQRRLGPDEPTEPEPTAPKKKTEPKNDSSILGQGILDKLENSLTAKFKKVVDEKTSELYEKVDGFKRTIVRHIYRAFFVCSILAAFLVMFFGWAIRGICNFIKSLFKRIIAREAQRLAVAAERVKTFASDVIADVDAGVEDYGKEKK